MPWVVVGRRRRRRRLDLVMLTPSRKELTRFADACLMTFEFYVDI